MSRKVIVLDWDDTLAPLEEYKFFPGVKEFLDMLDEDGNELIIVSGMADKEKILKTLSDNKINYIQPNVIYTYDRIIEGSDNLIGNFSANRYRKNCDKVDVINEHRIAKKYQKKDYFMLDDNRFNILDAEKAGYAGIVVERLSHRYLKKNQVIFDKIYKGIKKVQSGSSLKFILQFFKKYPISLAIGFFLPLLFLGGTIGVFILLNLFTAGTPTIIAAIAGVALGASGLLPSVITWGLTILTGFLSGALATFLEEKIPNLFHKKDDRRNTIQRNTNRLVIEQTSSYTDFSSQLEKSKESNFLFQNKITDNEINDNSVDEEIKSHSGNVAAAVEVSAAQIIEEEIVVANSYTC